MTKQYWVSPAPAGGRKIHSPGSKRDVLHTDNKADAVNRAREIAKNQSAELKIQKRDGKIHQSNSYGSDPFPPRDRK